MTTEERLALLEEVMELDEGELNASDLLKEYEEWDSISILSFIAMMDSKFGKMISGEEVKALQTVQDAIDLME